MERKRIYLASPHMGGNEINFVNEAFETNWIAPLGPNLENFEKDVAKYVDVKAAAGLVSGTSAIHLALKLVGVKTGDIVFCSSLTFSASCNPIMYEGGVPIFIDSEPESWNMSPVALEKAFLKYEKLNKLPKVVIAVNLYGQSADYDRICELCNKYNVPIIEDAAESLGATYKGKYTGAIGKFGIFSFNGNKIITTSGGGMLVSNDEEAIKKARFWSTQSRENKKYYHHEELGYNYRMSNIVAGIGRGQMQVLNDRISKKKEIYETYKEAFKEIDCINMMPICEYGDSNYWLSCMTIEGDVKPVEIIDELEKYNIESRHIWKPMHMQPYFEKYDFISHNDDCDMSVSEEIFLKGICLPSDTKMTKDEQYEVIEMIKSIFNR